jgi:hypothetical protein
MAASRSPRKGRRLVIAALPMAAAALAGACSSATPLSTGSLGAAATAAPAGPPPSDPTGRALHVAATSARAQKCGYFFDPAKVRANFIAAETQGGLAGDQLAKVQQQYDYTQATIARQIAGDADYCNSARTTAIKASLNRALAGDFTPPVSKAVESGGGLFGGIFDTDAPRGREVLNPDFVNDPWQKKTKRVEE